MSMARVGEARHVMEAGSSSYPVFDPCVRRRKDVMKRSWIKESIKTLGFLRAGFRN